MLRAVLFDLDGVFVESREVWFEVMRALARKLGYPEISDQRILAAWGQGIAEDVRHFYPNSTLEEIEREYNSLFPVHVKHLKVDSEGAEAVASLRARHLKIGVVTNSPTVVTRAMLERAGIVPDVSVTGSDVSEAKPAPDGILRALELLQVSPEEAIFVGDTAFDREAARRAAIYFVGFRIDGDHRVESLHEIVPLSASLSC